MEGSLVTLGAGCPTRSLCHARASTEACPTLSAGKVERQLRRRRSWTAVLPFFWKRESGPDGLDQASLSRSRWTISDPGLESCSAQRGTDLRETKAERVVTWVCQGPPGSRSALSS